MKAVRDLDNLLSNAPAGGATVVAIVISVLAAVLILVATILAAISITTAPSPNVAAARHHRRLHRLLRRLYLTVDATQPPEYVRAMTECNTLIEFYKFR